MDVIRDDGGTILAPDHWDSVAQFMATIRTMAEEFTLDHSAGQRTRLVVICEAAGMAPQLARVADPFGVTVMSSGGFDSLTDKHKFAAALSGQGRPTEVLHIGDHDPCGVSMFLAFLEDVEAFTRDLGGDVTFTRLAVTPRRSSAIGWTPRRPSRPTTAPSTERPVRSEALPPDVLADILRTAITERIDQRALDRVLRQERRSRRELIKRFEGNGGTP